MHLASLSENIEFNDNKPAIKVLLETDAGKEIRIVFKKGQVMKEHKTPFPIVVEIFEGEINFGVRGEIHSLNKGSLIALEGNVPHDLLATEDSIVRLSLNKADSTKRVQDVVEGS